MYIYSALANNITFVDYMPNEKERSVNMPKRIVVVNGGAGITNKKTGEVPLYVQTSITKEDYAWLKDEQMFKDFVSSGMMYSSTKQLDALDAISVLTGEDGCGSLTEERVKLSAKQNGIKSDIEVLLNSEQ